MPCFPGDRRHTPHEGAADSENVNVHEELNRKRPEEGLAEGADFTSLQDSNDIIAASACSFPMPKENKLKQQQMRFRIAAAAARIMAEDGLEDFALAKRKAARQLGAADTRSLPKNEEIEAELRAYQSLYQGDEQRERIRFLRSTALEAMRLLARFRPYLSGPVLKGTAGRYSEIDLLLFTDDGKAVELFLLNRRIPYEIFDQHHFAGHQVRAVTVLRLDRQGVPVNIAIYTRNEERGSVRTSSEGRPIERAGLQAVTQLVEAGLS
jgi:hypothetical protein